MMQQRKEGPLLLHDPTIYYIMTDELSYITIDVNIVHFLLRAYHECRWFLNIYHPS